MDNDYKVKLDIFEGPLDLLLYLIKKDEIDIYDIPIERITRQYLEYLDAFKILDLDIAGDFVVMAANLIYIKSRSLLPKDQRPPDEAAEEDDPALGTGAPAHRVQEIQGRRRASAAAGAGARGTVQPRAGDAGFRRRAPAGGSEYFRFDQRL